MRHRILIRLLPLTCLAVSPAQALSEQGVIQHYADLAHAIYADSLSTAVSLQSAVETLLEDPSPQHLESARDAWVAARVPYQQSEAWRFGNAWVDDWEGLVNAWPLDEGLIDYVTGVASSEDNPWTTANVIASTSLAIGGQTIDATTIDAELIGDTLFEVGGVESNVSRGYHAIEFLLWGQDLHGTSPGAGERPATDFSLDACTSGHCDRRRDYLMASTDLLVSDLETAVSAWADGGEARQSIVGDSVENGLARMLTGMGSLAYGELAGERIKLGLMLNDPEEEHDCFSDNTHWSHYYDAKSIEIVYTGSYTRVDGTLLTGPALSDLVAKRAPNADEQLKTRLAQTEAAMQRMVDEAEKGNTFDVLIGAGNAEGNAVVEEVVQALLRESRAIERVVSELDLGEAFNKLGSDALDDPSSI